MNPMPGHPYSDLSHPLNPANPVGLLNPVSPLYIGRQHQSTTQPSIPTSHQQQVDGAFVFGFFVVLLAVVLICVAFTWRK